MKAYIDGIAIDLTEDQIKEVEKVKTERKKCFSSFKKVLCYFGFKKGSDNSFVHKNGWYAEIIHNGISVWMTGEGLKNSILFPGGWVCSTPRELSEELSKINP